MTDLVFGWDVSTAIIGVCVMDLDSGISLRFEALRIEGETMLEKYDSAIGLIMKMFPTLIGRHFIEDRLGNFTQGKTMQQTLMKLAQMNAVVSHYLNAYGGVIHIHPSTAKRISGLKVPKGADKKLEAIKLVRSLDKQFPYRETKAGNPVAGIADMADAWLLATAGRKLLRGEATLGEGKKTVSGHGSVGPSGP